jgi:hydroxypyruvate reductase/glycerate 2-kinase
MNNREIAEHIFLSGIKGVLPGTLISNLISLRGPLLKIGYLTYDLEKIRNIYVIGAGKASASMAHYVETILGNRITQGYIVTKYGYLCRLKNIIVKEAGHPVPDINSFRSTEEILKIAETAGEGDLVICLWSGGGSSLMADYPETSSTEETAYLNHILVNSGAEITEMNVIRKHLSKVKGGQLARKIFPASLVTIYLSDVIGDPPDIIASGPTVPDNSTFGDALAIIEKYHLADQVPAGLRSYLYQGAGGLQPETPKPGDIVFRNSDTIIAGNIKTALLSAKAEAENLEFATFIVTCELKGNTSEACSFMTDTIYNYRNNNSLKRPICLLFGGETTVTVTGSGSGGRNQHLALSMAIRLHEIPGITFLSAGTDGNDSTTEMAGAIVDSETKHIAMSMNVDPVRYLEDFDSYNFFRSVGGQIFTGPTMTNVMDIAVVIIE